MRNVLAACFIITILIVLGGCKSKNAARSAKESDAAASGVSLTTPSILDPTGVNLPSIPSVNTTNLESVRFLVPNFQRTNQSKFFISFEKNNASLSSASTFQCKLDGGAFNTCGSPIQLSNLQEGPHTLSVRTINSNGQVSVTNELNWIVDFSAPVLELTSTIPSIVFDPTLSIAFEASALNGNLGEVRFECSLDQAAFVTCASPYTLNGLKVGFHQLRIVGFDQSQNQSNTLSVEWLSKSTDPNKEFIQREVKKTIALEHVTLGLPFDLNEISTDLSTANLVLSPIHGQLISEGSNRFRYFPNTGFIGDDVVAFATVDGEGNQRVFQKIILSIGGFLDIHNVSELISINQNLIGQYRLANAIDLTGQSFFQIGSVETPFQGVFDGAGFELQNLQISNLTESGSLSLIPVLDGTVKNLNLKSLSIETSAKVAGLVGRILPQGKLINVHVEGNIRFSNWAVGGLALQNEGLIEQSSFNGALKLFAYKISATAFPTFNVIDADKGVIGGYAAVNAGRIERSQSSMVIDVDRVSVTNQLMIGKGIGESIGGQNFTIENNEDDARVDTFSNDCAGRECLNLSPPVATRCGTSVPTVFVETSNPSLQLDDKTFEYGGLVSKNLGTIRDSTVGGTLSVILVPKRMTISGQTQIVTTQPVFLPTSGIVNSQMIVPRGTSILQNQLPSSGASLMNVTLSTSSIGSAQSRLLFNFRNVSAASFESASLVLGYNLAQTGRLIPQRLIFYSGSLSLNHCPVNY